MAEVRWPRSSSIHFPTTWAEFSRKDKDGNILHFTIKDLTEDLFEPSLEHMLKFFVPDEPLYKALGMPNDKISVEEIRLYWKNALPERLSLVCLLTKINEESVTTSEIVGILYQFYHHKEDDDLQVEYKGVGMNRLNKVISYLKIQGDICKLLNIDDFMDECGLSVAPDYRCMGIGTELMKARFEIAKAVGINTVVAALSGIGSQKATERAGYKLICEIKYSELAKLFPSYQLEKIKESSVLNYKYKIVTEKEEDEE